ncbi:restriction endonuclease [Salinibacterium sp. SYSU T00001]|uniref:restriction endonuclease n=1 Tax=Homoserinimonas sedimenticola TaxID=2986805 RepID=UPI002235A77C|nr:restriction endonuclease [Salinibacterium sedimenticola]MCW4384459.1 restriction endonuclease [Salinibacterium sedimenticola]
MANRLSVLSKQIRDADPTLTTDELHSFVAGVAKLAGSIGEEAGDAFETLHENLVAAILLLLDLADDELLGIQLRITWASEYSKSLIKVMSAQNDRLPAELDERKAEIARRDAARETLAVKSAPKISSLLEPILNAARDLAENSPSVSTSLIASEHPAPKPQLYGVSARGAELWVADALRWLGVHGVEVTQQTSDGGVDVLTKDFAVSVKHYSGAVPVEEVREIFGVATVLKKVPMLWTSGTLTGSGSEFAEIAPVAVFQYEVETATIFPANLPAQELFDGGFVPHGDAVEALEA